MSLTIGTLCTGIGLIDLGLEWAGLGPVLWQCEILPERRAVLEKWWPDVARFTDVRSLRELPGGITGIPWVDVIAFGSPCKNLSSAGDRSGLDGPSSSLFWDCLTVVERVRPRWVIFENVVSGASLWVDRVRGALERLDYQTIPVPLAASDLGAPHRRGRVFIIAHLVGDVVRDEPRRSRWENGTDPAIATNDGNPYGERESPFAVDAEVVGASGADSDAESPRLPSPGRGGREATQFARSPHSAWGEPIPDMVRVVHGGSDRLDGARQRVAALGDSCVPQCAEVIGYIVRMLDNA